jgi:hypothetical protein
MGRRLADADLNERENQQADSLRRIRSQNIPPFSRSAQTLG